MLYLKNPLRWFSHIIVVPLVSSLFIPIIILDIWMEVYHRICFPLYKIPYVRRKSYIQIFDRAKLPYLNWLQKIYCMYCGYANGTIRYWAQIAGRTEHYCCGIQHKKRSLFVEQLHQKDFAKYGDKEDFKKKYCQK